jgi:hypothetical protein
MYKHVEIDYMLLQDIYINHTLNIEQPCLICWSDNLLVKLNNYPNIVKICLCEGNYHKECLDTWFSKSLTCPLCRKKISFYQTHDFLHTDSFTNLPSYILLIVIVLSLLNIINVIYILLK